MFRDDFRRCSDSEDYPLNLMVFSGLPQHGWQNYLYGSIDELTSTEGLDDKTKQQLVLALAAGVLVGSLLARRRS